MRDPSLGDIVIALPGRRAHARGMWAERDTRRGAAILIILAIAAVAAPVLAPYDPLELTPNRLRSPNFTNLLGTDGLGRDVFSRLLFGARISLGSALLAATVSGIVGGLIGALSAYYGGAVDWALTRLADMVLSVPGLILALAVAALFESGLVAVVVATAGISWAGYSRMVRALVLSVKNRGYVKSARASGASASRIIRRHILPNVLSPALVVATLEIGHMLLAVSALSFLGLGVQPPTPEWGSMLNEGRGYLLSNPHLLVAPGLAIAIAVLGFNLIADGIRDALDPALAGSPLRDSRLRRASGSARRTRSSHPTEATGRARAEPSPYLPRWRPRSVRRRRRESPPPGSSATPIP